eukprot:g5384.t1
MTLPEAVADARVDAANAIYTEWSRKKLENIAKSAEYARKVEKQHFSLLQIRDKRSEDIRRPKSAPFGQISNSKRSRVPPKRISKSSERKKRPPLAKKRPKSREMKNNENKSLTLRDFAFPTKSEEKMDDSSVRNSKIHWGVAPPINEITIIEESLKAFQRNLDAQYAHRYRRGEFEARPKTAEALYVHSLEVQRKAKVRGRESSKALRWCLQEDRKLRRRKKAAEAEFAARKVAGSCMPWRVDASRLTRKRAQTSSSKNSMKRKQLQDKSVFSFSKSQSRRAVTSREPTRSNSKFILPKKTRSKTLESKLRIAARNGNASMIRKLVQRGAVINAKDWSKNRTALHYATLGEHADAVRTLIELGADINAVDNRGRTPLRVSELETIPRASNVRKRRPTTSFDRLCDPQWELDRRPKTSFSFEVRNDVSGIRKATMIAESRDRANQELLEAAANGETERVQMLLDKRSLNDENDKNKELPPLADVNCRDLLRRTPLHMAAIGGHEETVDLLLQHEATLQAHDLNKGEVIRYKRNLRRGYTTATPLLFNASGFGGRTPLQVASTPGAKRILAMAEDRQYRIENNIENMHNACIQGEDEKVKLLLKQSKIPIDATNSDGETGLHLACREGHIITAKILLENGADPGQVNKDGWNALHYASFQGHSELISLFLKNSSNSTTKSLVDVNSVDYTNRTALHLACFSGHATVVALLIGHGANPKIRTRAGLLPSNLVTNAASDVLQLIRKAEGTYK